MAGTQNPTEGGLLARLVEDAVHGLVEDCLLLPAPDGLGWGSLATDVPPLTVLGEPVEKGEVIQPNTLIVDVEDVDADLFEMGAAGPLAEGLQCYADLYAADPEFGKHVSGDLRAILWGKLPSIGRVRPTVAIMDNGATPTKIGYAVISKVVTLRQRVFDQPWEGLMFSTQFRVTPSVGEAG
jgi:hypothetical protein